MAQQPQDSPPSYSPTTTGEAKRDRLPPYKASHGFANSQEELAALKEFAESKLYIQPGTNGTLPDIRSGFGGLQSLAWGGPMQTGGRAPGESCWPAPETDEQRRKRRAEEKEQKKAERARRGSVTDRLKRVVSAGSSGSQKDK